MASNYYQNPSENLKLIGITGTNGKTTVATLLYELFKLAGYKVGLISTVKIMVDEQEFSTTHTTPDSLVINSYLSQMNTQGIEFCFMEVSSHGIHQYRTEGLLFDGGYSLIFLMTIWIIMLHLRSIEMLKNHFSINCLQRHLLL